jgi:sugar O-acyltransferase (sialic acid O-acetyltransferase NeuD family)
VIEADGRYRVAGLVGLPEEVGSKVLGIEVLGTDNDIPELVSKFGVAVIAVGQIKSPDLRIRLFRQLEQLGCNLPVIVSPNGYVSPHAQVGAGTIVMHGAVVNAAASVGRNCIINSQALVEHDVVVGDHCHIATSAAINSGVCIGAGTFVGSGSAIRQLIRIGERCVIGMGQCVVKNCETGTWLPAPQVTP